MPGRTRILPLHTPAAEERLVRHIDDARKRAEVGRKAKALREVVATWQAQIVEWRGLESDPECAKEIDYMELAVSGGLEEVARLEALARGEVVVIERAGTRLEPRQQEVLG